MATISKFYLHDAVTTNPGTMPGALLGGSTGDAVGARTARQANDVIGSGQTSATYTANADTNQQSWGFRRFISAPLGVQTFAAADGNWTFSYARAESNLNHNMVPLMTVYLWRPSTGTRVGTREVDLVGTEPSSAATEETESVTAAWGGTTTISDGDILVFEMTDNLFVQSMGTAYTATFYYDGTTEASATNCATFVSPPAAITLSQAVPPAAVHPHLPFIT